MKDKRLLRLFGLLNKHFSASELQTLCFALGIDYQDLEGSTRIDKARELVRYCERHNRIADLEAAIKETRPDVFEEGNNVSMSLTRDQWIKIVVALIGAAAVVIAALIGLLDGCSSTPTGHFVYQVYVKDQVTGEPLAGVQVSIMTGNLAPLTAETDNDGLAIIEVKAEYVDRLGRLRAEKSGYVSYERHVNLSQQELPTVIQLEPQP